MDLPISILHWELFLPERYQMKGFGGNVISTGLLPVPFREQRVQALEAWALGQRRLGAGSLSCLAIG